MSNKHPCTVLLDVDDTLLDFRQHSFTRLGQLGYIPSEEGWDVFPDEESFSTFAKFLPPGWVYSMPLRHGTLELLRTLRSFQGVRVVAVTSPLLEAPTWCYERAMALKQRLGFEKRDIVFAADKSLVEGDVFGDDHPKHATEWGARWTNGHAFLVSHSWTMGEPFVETSNTKRLLVWPQLIDAVQTVLKRGG